MTCTYVVAHRAKPAIRHYMSTGARAFPAQLTAYHESRRGATRPNLLDIVYVAVASSIAKYITPSHVLPTSCPRLDCQEKCPQKMPSRHGISARLSSHLRDRTGRIGPKDRSHGPERPSPTRRVPTLKASMYMVLGRVLPSRQFAGGR